MKRRHIFMVGLGVVLAVPTLAASLGNQNSKRDSVPQSSSSKNMTNIHLCDGMMPIMGMITMMGPSLYEQHTDGCLGAMKAALAITASQEPQWLAFSNAVHDNIATTTKMFDAMMTLDRPRATLGEWLQIDEQAMALHLKSITRIREKLDDLRGVLGSEQIAAAQKLRLLQ